MESTPSSMDDPSVHVLEYRSYLFSVSVVFTLKDILGQSNFVSTECGGFFNFLRIWKYWIIPVRSKRNLDHITNIIWWWRLCRILTSFFHISWIYLILFNIYLFSWILFLTMLLSLLYVMALTLLNFPIRCWLDIASRTCCTIFGYFLTIIRIQILVLFISSKAWFRGLLFVDWDIYDMLWCS